MHCPIDYALSFDKTPTLQCETLYVVGGLYGNMEALEALKRIIEPNALVVFNGDIHWFDANAELFLRIEEAIAPYILLNGNVEMELSRDVKSGAGCGCFYPECVSESTKVWAHEIHAILSTVVDTHLSAYKKRFQERKACLSVWVGAHNVAITHGDETSLAGWGCSHQNLRKPERQEALNQWFESTKFSVLASSHTCEAALLHLENGVLINNGAAGLPNFKALGSGLVTRISTTQASNALYGTRFKTLFIDALMLDYDAKAFQEHFCAMWDRQSPASLSYLKRITEGVSKEPQEALIPSFYM